MRVWVDPKETAVDVWGALEGDDALDAPHTPMSPVFERALSTRYPIQYTDGAYLTPMAADQDGRARTGYARIQFNCAVDRLGTIKLTARGVSLGRRRAG